MNGIKTMNTNRFHLLVRGVNMKFLTVFIILFPLLATANSLKGYESPKAAVEAFVSPLKQGSKGVSTSIESINSLNGDSYAGLGKSLTKDIKENGKVIKMKEIDSDSRLNGLQQKVVYEIEFANGKKRQLQMELIKPADNAGFHIMKMEVE